MDDPVRAPLTAAADADAAKRPLVVDLDGCLVYSDTTLEACLAAAGSPLILGRALLALRQGRAAFKRRLAQHVVLDAARLPYNEPLVAYLRAEHASGRPLVLATGADYATASAVAAHLGLFDRVLASDGKTNLTGANKLAAIGAALNGAEFTYVGNSATDLLVWCGAAGAICVNARPRVERAAAQLTLVERRFPPEPRWARLLLRAMRPQHWAENLLVFLPLVAAGALGELSAWLTGLVAFIAFCGASSALSLFDDLTDLAAARQQPSEARRPFASGKLSLPLGLIAAAALVLFALGLGFAVGAILALIAYVALAGAHSLWLKRRPLFDVPALAASYALRLVGGGAATGHPASPTLLAFCAVLFVAIALGKRAAAARDAAP